MALTDAKIRSLKPKEKPYKANDALGLYLLISPNGSKHWKLKYQYDGKEKKLSYGAYPEVTLMDARRKRDESRSLLANDINPAVHKKERLIARKLGVENSFELIALEWHAKNLSKWTPAHGDRILTRFKKDIFPWAR